MESANSCGNHHRQQLQHELSLIYVLLLVDGELHIVIKCWNNIPQMVSRNCSRVNICYLVVCLGVNLAVANMSFLS